MAGPWEKYGAAETPSGPWQKYGAAPPAPSAGVGDAVANFAKNFWGEMTQTGQGMVDMFSHNPLDTVKGIGAAQDAIRLKAQDAMKRGDYTEAARHAINYLIPLVGPGLDVRGDQAQRGDISGALGGTTAIGAQMFGPNALESAISAAPRVASAVGTAADATKAAVKAGVKDVAVGGGKMAVAAALAKYGPLGEVADVIAGMNIAKSGLKQTGRGVRAGYTAGKAALTPSPVEPPLGGIGILSPDYFDRLRLPPGPTITPSAPAPPDASFVRAVPAEYPTVESPLIRGAQQAGGFTPEEQARAAAILENVEPTTPPAQPPATAPAAAPKPAAAELAQQFEATTRPDRMLDFLKRMDPEISAAAIDNLDPSQWELVARGAGSPAGTIPTPEDIASIRGNLAQSEGASQITAKTPGEAVMQFEQNREIRKGPAKATEPAPAGAPTYTEPERRALAEYMSESNPVNSSLRTEGATAHLDAAHIDNALTKYSLPEDSTLYRGFDRPMGWSVGDTITDKGFSSTSTNMERAALEFGRRGEVAVIRVPKGTNAVKMADISHPDVRVPYDQQEVLLPRGMNYIVRKVEFDPTLGPNGKNVVYLDASPPSLPVPESWRGPQPPPAGPPAPTASEVRVEAFAKHLAQWDIPTKTIEGLQHKPSALLQLEELGRSLGIEGRPAPGEVQQIVDRVRELRGEGAARKAK